VDPSVGGSRSPEKKRKEIPREIFGGNLFSASAGRISWMVKRERGKFLKRTGGKILGEKFRKKKKYPSPPQTPTT